MKRHMIAAFITGILVASVAVSVAAQLPSQSNRVPSAIGEIVLIIRDSDGTPGGRSGQYDITVLDAADGNGMSWGGERDAGSHERAQGAGGNTIGSTLSGCHLCQRPTPRPTRDSTSSAFDLSGGSYRVGKHQDN